MGFDNPQENDGLRNEDGPQGSGDAGVLLRMMDPRMRQAAGMSADPAGEEGPGEPSLPQGEPQSDEGEQSGSIGNRIVEMQSNAPGRIPSQNAARDDEADAPPPDLRVVDVQRAQTMNNLPPELFKLSSPPPVLEKQDGGASSGQGGGQSGGQSSGQSSGQNSGQGNGQSGGQGGKGDTGAFGSTGKNQAQGGEKAKMRTDPFYSYATLAAKLPAENRGVYLMRLHDVLTQNFLRSGKMAGPDGKMYSAESSRQAEALVKQWVDDAMQDYRDANPYGTRTTPMPPEQKPKWEDKHWILSGLKNSIPELKKLPAQALHTLKKQVSFDEHQPGEKADPNMLPDPANLLDDKHWIIKGLMHTVYDPNRNANDVVRAVGRGLDPLVDGLTGGVVDLRHGELHRPGKALAKLAGMSVGIPPQVMERIYASMPEHTKSLWDTAHGNSIYGKDTDLNVDLRGVKKATGPIGRLALPDEFNVQRGFDAVGKATGEYVRDQGIGKALNGAVKGSEILEKLVKNPKAREILRTLLKETTKSVAANAAQTDVDEEGKPKDNMAWAAAKGLGTGTMMEGRMRLRPWLSKIATKKATDAVGSRLQNMARGPAVAEAVKELVHKEGGPAMKALMGVLKEVRQERKEEGAAKNKTFAPQRH